MRERIFFISSKFAFDSIVIQYLEYFEMQIKIEYLNCATPIKIISNYLRVMNGMGLPVQPLGKAILSQFEIVGAMSGIITGWADSPC